MPVPNSDVPVPSPEVPQEEEPEQLVTFYIYRAQSEAEYPNENINAADLPGLLYYLQNEVVQGCPRKFGVTRIRRMKVTTRRNQFVPFEAFDSAQCTAEDCLIHIREAMYSMGCQSIPDFCGSITGLWYSLPGPCPYEPFDQKSPECEAADPGGLCAPDNTDLVDCKFLVENAGSINLNMLVGLTETNCTAGMEYDRHKDKGDTTNFWDDAHDEDSCMLRLARIKHAFLMQYPDMPAEIEETPPCQR